MDRFEWLQQELTRRCPGLEVRANEPMSRHTSFRIGGPARLMALPKSAVQAKVAVLAAREANILPFSWATAPTCWWPMKACRLLCWI